MHIGIDGRCLQDAPRTGVGESAFHLIQALARLDQHPRLSVFTNAYRGADLQFQDSQINIVQSQIPNKWLNARMKLFRSPIIDSFLGDIDLFFAPNWNVMRLSPSRPFVLTIHDASIFLYPEFYSPYSRFWHKHLLDIRGLVERADHIFVPSATTLHDLKRLFAVKDEKITVLPWGADHVAKHEARNMKRETDQKKYILFLAALEARKNVLGIIRAFEELQARRKSGELKLVLAGARGYGFGDIERAVRLSPFKKDIELVGPVTAEEKHKLYSRAALFVYPSFYEGFGLPPLEAMSYGVPVVASSSAALGEVLANAALLVQPYQVNDLAAAMEKLLFDDRLRALHIQRGYETIQKYQWKKTAERAYGVFEQVLSS